jgi:hypothetical protein
MIGRSGIGHGKLSGDDFRTLAVKLDAMSQTGGRNTTRRSVQRQNAAKVAEAMGTWWTSGGEDDKAGETSRALAGWCENAAEARRLCRDMYAALGELATAARETGAVIDRVEEHERGWMEQSAYNVGEWGARGLIVVGEQGGVLSEEEARARRESIDERNRMIDQASTERAEALEKWLRAMEGVAHAIDAAHREVKAKLADVPEALRPTEEESSTPQRRILDGWTKAVNRGLKGPASDDANPVGSESSS